MPRQQDKCFLCGQVSHVAADCKVKPKSTQGEHDEKSEAEFEPKEPFSFYTYGHCMSIWNLTCLF